MAIYTNGSEWQRLIKEGLDKQKPYSYKDKRISVTALANEFRYNWLARRYGNEKVESINDRVWLMFGTAFHEYLENLYQKFVEVDEETYLKLKDKVVKSKTRKSKKGTRYFIKPFLKETRIEVVLENSWTVSGILDCYNVLKGIITDWKTASVNKLLFKDWTDYKNQIMAYAWILTQLGLAPTKAEDIVFFKDWAASKAERDHTYPQEPFYQLETNISDLTATEKRIKDYVFEFAKLENTPDNELPLCNEDYRSFGGKGQFAIMKNNNKRAIRVFDSEYEAQEFYQSSNLENSKDKYYIAERPREEKRCMNYCDMCFKCSHFIKNYANWHVIDENNNIVAGFKDFHKAKKYWEMIKNSDLKYDIVPAEREDIINE